MPAFPCLAAVPLTPIRSIHIRDPNLSIHWPILRTCLRHPRRSLIVDDNRSYRGIDLAVAAFHAAQEISRRSSTQTVGVMFPSSGAFPIAALGAWILGRTVVPLNFLLKPEELQYVIDDCETDTILTAGPMLNHLGFRPRVKNLIEMDRLSFKGVPEVRWPARVDDDQLAVILYTSGTSGRPKGVMLSHANISANIAQCLEFIPSFTPASILLGVLPQFHSFGLTVLTLLPLTLGCRAIFSARFVPARLMKLIREQRPTAMVMIPSMYNALLHVKDATPEDFASLTLVVSGGEPLPRATADAFRERFKVTLTEGYGLTETSPATNVCLPEHQRLGSVGRALPRIDQRTMDYNTMQLLPRGVEGEIVMRGPNVMKGYLKLPDETAKTFTDGGPERGYFRTGDIGRIDDDGYLFITGRLKEMIIVGGENVFPREIEEVLNRHPAVNASGVIGQQDPMRGELPVAFVELKEGASAIEKDLLTWCRERLAGYKVPTAVRIVPALPRNPTGKIMRRELKKLA